MCKMAVVETLWQLHTLTVINSYHYSTNKVAKIGARHKLVSVRAEGYVPSSHQLQKSGNAQEVSSLWCEAAGQLCSRTALLKICPSSASLQMVSWYWLFSFSSFVQSPYTFVHVCVQAKKLIVTGPRTNRGYIFKFYSFSRRSMVIACTFLPLFYVASFMRSYAARVSTERSELEVHAY